MKTRVFLIISVCANVALAAVVLRNRNTELTTLTGESTAAAPAASERVIKRPGAAREIPAAPAASGDFDWASIESEDYREYIENLRSIGCPEETIRDIIIADINKLYGARIAALYPSPQQFQFWRVEDRSLRNEQRERDEKRRALEREKRDLIRELLGVDYDAELARVSGRPDEDAYRYGFLSPEKQEQVRALVDRFREQERAIWSEGGGWSAENRAKFAALRAQREAELAQLLGPQDFEQYLLRNSWTARNMRENLAAFSPSEDEFREVFKVRKAFDDQFGFTRDGGDDALREQRRVAMQQMEEQLKALLGERRYQEYQLAQDERFRDIYDFTQRQNLPRQTAETVYEMRRAAENTRREVEQNPNLTPEARAAALAALANETRQALGEALGEQGLSEYLRRNGGWVSRLAQVDTSNRGGSGESDRFRRR